MALDTYLGIVGKVLLRCPAASQLLARDWVNDAFRRVAERRSWSWLTKQSQFIMNAVVTTGTVTCTRGSTTVTGSGTAFTSTHIGRQFRVTSTYPIYTISNVTNGPPNILTLDNAWGGASLSGASYEIYNAYGTVPTDFNYFVTIWDPNFNWQLHRNIAQTELNVWDAQRSNRGQAYLTSFRDYASTGLPRYEIWPHVTSDYVLPYLYVSRATDLEDSGASLPTYLRGDVLLEMALAEAAKWPGPSEDKKNPYFNLNLAKMHETKAEFMIAELERQDDEVSMQNYIVSYTTMPWAPLPFGDANWLQRHAI